MHTTRIQRHPLIAYATTLATLCVPALFALPAMALPVSANLLSQLSGVVSIVYDAPAGSGGSPVGCTGVLVGANTVLTAAHCGAPDGNLLTMPSVLFDGVSSVAVTKATVNPTYNSNTQFGDLQVLTLAQAAPTSAQIYGIYGASVPDGQFAVTVGTHSGTNGILIDSTGGSHWQSTGSGVQDGDSGGPLFVEVEDQAALLGNVTFGVDTGSDGVFDIFGGTLFKDFLDFLISASTDFINVLTSGLVETPTPPPPPPPPPAQPVHYVFAGVHPALTVIGANDLDCTKAALTNPCPGVLTKSVAFQEVTDGFVTFDFLYKTLDEDSVYDPAGYFIGDELFQFTDNTTSQLQEGFNQPISILAGQLYGFYVESADQAFGGARLDVSNIRVFARVQEPSQDVPEPGSLTLAALAIAGLAVSHRRRQGQPLRSGSLRT